MNRLKRILPVLNLAAVERARQELERAEASGDAEAIRRATNIYNNLVAVVINKYGDIL